MSSSTKLWSAMRAKQMVIALVSLGVMIGLGYAVFDRAALPSHPYFKSHRLVNTIADTNGNEWDGIVLAALPVTIDMAYGRAMFLNTVRIEPDLSVEFNFGPGYLLNTESQGTLEWRKAKFSISQDDYNKIIAAIDKERLLDCAKEYQATFHDGAQLYLKVRFASHCKSVKCNNYFPTAATNVFDSIIEHSIKNHEREIKSSARRVMTEISWSDCTH